jgi:hypothetical protein
LLIESLAHLEVSKVLLKQKVEKMPIEERIDRFGWKLVIVKDENLNHNNFNRICDELVKNYPKLIIKLTFVNCVIEELPPKLAKLNFSVLSFENCDLRKLRVNEFKKISSSILVRINPVKILGRTANKISDGCFRKTFNTINGKKI